MAFDQIEPDPAEVTMLLTAQLVTLFHNVYRDRKARPRPYEVRDFLPHEPDTQTVMDDRRFADVLAEMRSAYAARQQRKH